MRLTIPGEPVGKQRPKVFNGHGVTPKKTVNYETLVRYTFQQSGEKMLDGELEVEINAYYSIAPSTSKKKAELMRSGDIRPVKKPDLDNIAKIICDALNKIAYNDDSQIVSLKVEKYYSDNPRVDVRIGQAIPLK